MWEQPEANVGSSLGMLGDTGTPQQNGFLLVPPDHVASNQSTVYKYTKSGRSACMGGGETKNVTKKNWLITELSMMTSTGPVSHPMSSWRKRDVSHMLNF